MSETSKSLSGKHGRSDLNVPARHIRNYTSKSLSGKHGRSDRVTLKVLKGFDVSLNPSQGSTAVPT